MRESHLYLRNHMGGDEFSGYNQDSSLSVDILHTSGCFDVLPLDSDQPITPALSLFGAKAIITHHSPHNFFPSPFSFN